MTEHVRFSAAGTVDGDAAIDETSRRISWVFSNEDVCLDQHTIRTGGWDLTDYLKNPVLLFAHDQSAPPIGRVTRIEAQGKLLVGDTVFADAETYPFADTIYRLVKGRYLNATSVSWFPLDSKPARDRSRPDGIDFLAQKLLEISVVPVPANPAALATARARGIDTSPLRLWAERVLDEHLPGARAARLIHDDTRPATPAPARAESKDAKWKCGASRSLPLDEDAEWDGPAAQKAVFEACGFDGDKPDLSKARKAFLAYDAANPKKRGSYKLPFATVQDGRLTAVAAGLKAAAARLSQTDVPQDVQDAARAVIDEYEGKMKKPKADRAAVTVTKRGLYEVSNLAYLLAQLGYIKSCVDDEEENEGDEDSVNPANMAAVLQALGKALVEMTAEEVSELLEARIPGLDAEGARGFRGRLSRAKLSKDDKDQAEEAFQHCARSHRLLRANIDNFKDEDLSDQDVRSLMMDAFEGVHDHAVESARRVREFIDGQAPPTADNLEPTASRASLGPSDRPARKSEEKTAEERKLEAAALRAKSLIHD
jgi:HK97 family phage prohead protease